MIRTIFLLGAITLASVSTLSQGAQGVQKAMYVSVVDQAGAPVPRLGPADFIVREDDIAREVLTVVPADEPMQVAVLVDTSDVAREQIPYLRDAVPTFVNTLISGVVRNQVAIVGFGERPTILADYTSNRADLKKATDLIWANPMSGPYLLDAILEVSEGITKREAPRPVIVAIAAEGQELSYRHYDQVLEPLRKSGAQLYVLMLGTPYVGTNEEARSREIVISRGPSDSGGRREQVLTAIGLGSRLKLLADQLTHQYRVTYSRPQTLIPPEKVTVSATGPGRTARGTLIKDTQTRQ
jgi:von Willebrand factor type A domain-containing protein